jgi:pyruvate dehydrogenase E2 component (dihydrolipoamide acetyltransferase)
MYGIESFSPIINQPEVAILGVNAIKEELSLKNGEVVAVPMLKLSLTADHRAVDGAVAAEFLRKLKQYAENPYQLLL